MRPRKGDLTFDPDDCGAKAVWLWTRDSEHDFPDERIATDSDLAGMGLVRKWRFDELSKQLAQIADICIGKETETEQPTPRAFKVGDKVRIVRSTPWRNFETGTVCVGGTGTIRKISDAKTSGSEIDVSLERTINGYNTAGVMSADLELIKAAPEEPAQHKWEVGQYAIDKEGIIQRVVDLRTEPEDTNIICLHGNGWHKATDCTPVPEPPMPELPVGWKLHNDGRLSFIGETGRFLGVPNTLEAQIAFFQKASSIYKGDVAFLLALDDWRKLTGRVV